MGSGYRVIEEGLNGRSIGFEDTIEPYRNGYDYVIPCILTHEPIDLMVIMLGTNDTKGRYALTPSEISYEMENFLQRVKSQFMWDRQGADILLVSPALFGDGEIEEEFGDAARQKAKKLAPYFKQLAEDYGCFFLDAGELIKAHGCDNIHFSPEDHRLFALEIENKIREIFA